MKVLAAVLCVLAGVYAKHENHDENYRVWESKWNYIQTQLVSNQTWKQAWEENMRKHKESLKDPLPIIPFNCENIPGPTPTNVHQLRPQDISVVGALGDSVSAGFGIGATSAPEVVIQNRGEVFSIGVDRNLEGEVMTMTNVLKKFNPDIKGGSTGTGWDTDPNSWLNVAVGGAKANNMPAQADRLVGRINFDLEIDADIDWKLITLFIGGNDFCQDCRQNPATRHVDNILEALDILHEELTRTIVQVVVMFDVSPLTGLSTGFVCDALHLAFCPCATNVNDIPLLKPIQVDVYQQLRDTIEGGYYDTRDDFTVILQPSMTHLVPAIDPDTGLPDTSYFSPDCFHPGRKGHQAFSYILWNTMMTKVGNKPLDYPEESESEREYICPTLTEPYIWTNVNSGFSKKWTPRMEAYAATHPRDNGSSVAGIVGGVVGAIVGVALIAVIAVVVYQRRTVKKREDTTVLHLSNPAADTA